MKKQRTKEWKQKELQKAYNNGKKKIVGEKIKRKMIINDNKKRNKKGEKNRLQRER